MFAVFNLFRFLTRDFWLDEEGPSIAPNCLFGAASVGSLAVLSDDRGVENFRRAITVPHVRPNGTATGRFSFRYSFIRV